MSKPLAGQTAIVTGAARGIGLGIAQRLAADGARVAIWDINLELFKPDTAGFVPAHLQAVDVSNMQSVQAAFDATTRALGEVHLLVNNAGINGPVQPTLDYPLEMWDKVLAVNLNSVFYCTRAVLPGMKARKAGRIINIASMAGKEGVVNLGAYSASKGGVIAFTKAIAKELALENVIVNCVAPALVETELFAQMTAEHIANMKAKIPMGRAVQISDVANMVAFIAGPDCAFTTGFVFDVSGGRAVY